MTSDERREVAARLRREADGYREFAKKWPEACRPYIDYGNAPGYVEDIAAFIGVVQGERRIYPTEDIFDRLADLIDPTCQVSSVETYDDELGQLEGLEFHLTCGHSFQRPWNEPPAYCPECGARVVDEDGD